MGWRSRPDVPGVSGTSLTEMVGLRPTMAPRHADRFTRQELPWPPRCSGAYGRIIVWGASRSGGNSIRRIGGDERAIWENLLRVQDRIAGAAISAGRRPEDVTLVAVSKTKPAEAVAAALAAGQSVFGENRVQEAAGKFPALRENHRLSLHLIGGLQTNKAREAVRIADVIESLDRPKLADAIEAAICRRGGRRRC